MAGALSEMAGALIGEASLSASIEGICDKIDSVDLMDFFWRKELDHSLQTLTFLVLDAVVDDAEEEQIEKPRVEKWLGEIRHAVLDAKDLLHEIDTEVLRSKVEAEFSTKKTQADLWDERPASSSPNKEIYEPRQKKKAASAEGTFLFVSLCLEILSIAFDQASSTSKPQYALFGMLLAIVGVLISALEFIYKGIKGKVVLRKWGKLWWFYFPPPPCYKLLGTVIEIYGLVGSIAQCVSSIIQYVYFSQHLDSPFKVSLLPAILVLCLITSRLSKDRMRIRDGAGGRSL